MTLTQQELDKTYTDSRALKARRPATRTKSRRAPGRRARRSASRPRSPTASSTTRTSRWSSIIIAGTKAKFGWKVEASVSFELHDSITKKVDPGRTLFFYGGLARVVADGNYTYVDSDCSRKEYHNIRVIAPYALRTWSKMK